MNNTELLLNLLKERILIIDGAMGTMIQTYGLTEEHYRGERFKDFHKLVKGNNDMLVLTQPDIIRQIHSQFLDAGADIIETNTFNAQAVSMEDYDMAEYVYEINFEAAKLAKQVAQEYTSKNTDKPRFVAGSMGPTTKLTSMSPDVNNPGYRSLTFAELISAYTVQLDGLIDGGVDLILLETVTDTLNVKAGIFALEQIKEQRNIDLPLMISGTITDKSGRTLSGQTPEAFWYSVAHANPISIGLNCALGAKDMIPHLHELSKSAWTHISAYPNAGLPNEFGQYDESPEFMASVVEEFLKNELINIVGGCCGTTPQHIKAIAEIAQKYNPRKVPMLQAQ